MNNITMKCCKKSFETAYDFNIKLTNGKFTGTDQQFDFRY